MNRLSYLKTIKTKHVHLPEESTLQDWIHGCCTERRDFGFFLCRLNVIGKDVCLLYYIVIFGK